MIQIFSFGGGVQSWTILELVRENKLPRPDHMLFADTGWEPDEVYDGVERARWIADGLDIPFDTVQLGDIRADHIRRAMGYKVASGIKVPRDMRSFRSMPLFTRMPDRLYLRELEEHYIEVENWERKHPVGWTDPRNGLPERPPQMPEQNGMMPRACTERYKIRPIERRITEVYGRKSMAHWFGISTDERSRERVSKRKHVVFRYPLLADLPMSRAQCLTYLAGRGINPPKSACIACPYHGRQQWLAIKADPKAWASAVEFDRLIRHMPGGTSECFVHPARIPLDQVDLDRMDNVGQTELFGMQNECVGMCGV